MKRYLQTYLIQTLEYIEAVIRDTPAIIAGRPPNTILEGPERDIVLERINVVLKRAYKEAAARSPSSSRRPKRGTPPA